MDILFRRGRATAADIYQDLSDRSSYSAVRAHLRTLEEKGYLCHEAEDLRYVYIPTLAPEKARKSALRHLVETFFEGSAGRAAAALLDADSSRISRADLDRLAGLIEKARKEEA